MLAIKKLKPMALSALLVLGAIVWLQAELLTPPAMAETGRTSATSLFEPILKTIQHPRCMNCHTTTEFPRQNDNRQQHFLGVERGPENHGIPGMRCSTCHGDSNNDFGGVPGAEHWGLAPLSMAWEYMTPSQICAQLKDPKRNGEKSLDELGNHMTEDPLVLWAWKPGKHPDGTTRSRPPLSEDDWIDAVEKWIAADAPCPSEASTTEGTE